MTKLIGLLFILLMASCADDPYDMTQPREFQIDASFSPEEQASIVAHLSQLSDITGQHIGVTIGINREERVIVRRVGDKGGEWGGHRQINIGTVWLTPDNAGLLAAHEMGHDLGMDHVKGASLMSPVVFDCDGMCWSPQDQSECDRVGACKN